MRKKWLCLLLAAVGVCLLSACSAFESEYVSIHDYAPSVQEPSRQDGKINVRNYSALKSALLSMAYSGQTEGSIVFDAAYEGDTTEDMASACWAVRTQDALCAYCVENIAYELNKIVTIHEASVYISYSDVTERPEDIVHLAFSAEAEEEILDALRGGERKLALLVGRSAFSAEDMAAQVTKAYRENPTVVPREPNVNVNIFSGNGSQRLYEIHINYRLTQEELEERLAQLSVFEPFAELDPSEMTEAERAYTACAYLMEHCTESGESGANNAYSALITGQADSEGVAFGYVELCRRLGLDCRIVYGQHDWQDHCWNIVRVDGNSYHVDVTRCMAGELPFAFLKNDESFWGLYRWDVASYPKCTAEFDDAALFPHEEEEEQGTEQIPEPEIAEPEGGNG